MFGAVGVKLQFTYAGVNFVAEVSSLLALNPRLMKNSKRSRDSVSYSSERKEKKAREGRRRGAAFFWKGSHPEGNARPKIWRAPLFRFLDLENILATVPSLTADCWNISVLRDVRMRFSFPSYFLRRSETKFSRNLENMILAFGTNHRWTNYQVMKCHQRVIVGTTREEKSFQTTMTIIDNRPFLEQEWSIYNVCCHSAGKLFSNLSGVVMDSMSSAENLC